MGEIKDLTGQRFGRLTVRERSTTPHPGSRAQNPWWVCVCDCGVVKDVVGVHLFQGRTVSCGCFGREQTATFYAGEAARATLYEIDGESLSISGWAARSGRQAGTIRVRLLRGMSPKEAVYGALGKGGPKRRAPVGPSELVRAAA